MTAERQTEMIIRADGNARIGAGHLMRCLTIADEIRDRDSVCFWCADEASAALAESRGYRVRTLGTDYRNMLSELPHWEEWMGQEGKAAVKGSRVILVDSYYGNSEYLQALEAYGRVYLLDDMQKQDWPVDGVINYHAFARKRDYELLYARRSHTHCYSAASRLLGMPKGEKAAKAEKPELYIGPAYIPLRPQFAGRDFIPQRQVKEILLTTGGGDRENIAGRILERIGNVNCRIHVISGPFNPHGIQLAEYAAAHPYVTLHRQVAEMAELMLQCDLAITAGGTTVYELCALGIPFICFSYAENQEALTEYTGRQGIGWNAGRYHREPEKVLMRIAEAVREAMANWHQRQQMSQKARALVDGLGARRLAQVLENAAGCACERIKESENQE